MKKLTFILSAHFVLILFPRSIPVTLKPLILLSVLAISFLACHKQHRIVSIKVEPDYEKAESFLYVKNDSAYYYFNKVVSNSLDSLQIAMAYNRMASMQSDAGDYFGSQERLLNSLRHLNEQDEKDLYCLSSDYNELGGTSLNLKNYDAAIEYYDLALKYVQDEEFKFTILNNKAVVYQKKKDFPQAITIYNSIISKNLKDKRTYARILSNRGRTRWLQDSAYKAAPELLAALQIRLKENDYWGQNASYAHLSDFYSHSRPDSALIYADKMYSVACYLNSPDDEVEALQKLIILSAPQSANRYFTRYQYLDDSIQTARNTAKNQFALIRYNAEKNKVENLRLQKENAEKKVLITQQSTAIYVAVLIILIIIGWYRKYKQQTVFKAEALIREHALKTSQKVHDIVANGLYRLMAEIQYKPDIEKEEVLNKIDTMYEQSRQISYEYEPSVTSNQNHESKIVQLLESFSTDTIKVFIVGSDSCSWQKINAKVMIEVEHILQELMINMRKHSKASIVVIRFEQQNNCIKIQYTDDGVGLPPKYSFGNGLRNTGNRIKKIKGTIIFENNLKGGLLVQASFPIK